MAEIADCCGCCLLCCACVSVCGRLCLWIPCPGDRRRAKAIEDDEEFAQQVERETFGIPSAEPSNYVQPAPQNAPIVNPTRQSRSAPNPKAAYEVPQGGDWASDGRAQGNGYPEHPESLPPRISQDTNLPSNYEYPPQPPRNDRPDHVRGPSTNSDGYPVQQQAASSLPNEHRRVRSND